jgi:uncharacterized membrane protein
LAILKKNQYLQLLVGKVMETTLTDSKRKITDWVNSIEEESLLDKIMQMMKECKLTEDEKKVAFDCEFAKGIFRDELLKRVNAHIDSLPWKNHYLIDKV